MTAKDKNKSKSRSKNRTKTKTKNNQANQLKQISLPISYTKIIHIPSIPSIHPSSNHYPLSAPKSPRVREIDRYFCSFNGWIG